MSNGKITTIEELIDKLPIEWRPVIIQFGPLLLKKTVDELWAWIALIAAGKGDEAYRELLVGMNNTNLLNQWDNVNDAWATANKANTTWISLQREATLAVLRVALGMALFLVGL